MLKILIKLFMPKTDELAKQISTILAEAINNQANITNAMVKYYPYAEKLTEVQTTLVKWMQDGKIDENEKQELANALVPIIDKVRKEAGL